MDDFEKKLQAIRLNAARHCPKLVAEALELLLYEKYASEVSKVAHPVWKNILSIIEPLYPSTESTELSAQYLKKLILLVEEKYHDERHIASMVPYAQHSAEAYNQDSPGELICTYSEEELLSQYAEESHLQHSKGVPYGPRKKAARFSNYNEIRFRRLLHKLIRHSRAENDLKKKLEACLETHFGFFLALKELHWLDMNAYDINGKRTHLKRMELYNAIYAAMSKNLSTPESQPLFCGFRHCDVCPRLVRPPEFGVCRCEAHDYKNGITIVYKQALEISSLQTPKHHNSLLEYLRERFLRRLRRALPERYPEGISHAEWWRLLDEDPERLAACNAPVLYDLVPVWQVLPRTRKLVESKGGNPLDRASVIAVLNPPEAGEPPEWKERRAVLNTILACNIAPFRFELAFTEAWLTIRDKLFGHKKHGGARPGSGGARPGAGRPRKHE